MLPLCIIFEDVFADINCQSEDRSCQRCKQLVCSSTARS